MILESVSVLGHCIKIWQLSLFFCCNTAKRFKHPQPSHLSRYFNWKYQFLKGKKKKKITAFFIIPAAMRRLNQDSSYFCWHNPQKNLEKLCMPIHLLKLVFKISHCSFYMVAKNIIPGLLYILIFK